MATTIKIDREVLIKTLNDKAAQMEKDNAIREKEDKAYKAAVDKWERECVAFALKNVKKANHLNVSINWSAEHVGISFYPGTLAARPEVEYTGEAWSEWEIREIKQFVRMLEMSNADSINMSALKNVSQYL